QYRKRRRLQHRLLGELLGVVSAGLSRQDDAAPTNHHTKVPNPPVKPGLHPSLQAFRLGEKGRWADKRFGRLRVHGSASRVAGRPPVEVPRPSAALLSSARWMSTAGGAVIPSRTRLPPIATTVSRMSSPMTTTSPCLRLSTNIVHAPFL